jgi:hypothetical protein
MIDILDGLTLDEADALCRRIRADYPQYRHGVLFHLHDADDPFSPFVVTAFLPGSYVFHSLAQYEAWEASRD